MLHPDRVAADDVPAQDPAHVATTKTVARSLDDDSLAALIGRIGGFEATPAAGLGYYRGAYVTPGDAPGLADRIEALLANSGEVRELTERAEHHVAEHFSVAAKRKVFARIFGDLGVPQG